MNDEELRRNKAVVVRFNKEVIENGNEAAFRELTGPGFVNRTAPPGTPAGPQGMLHTFNRILRPAFPDLRVEIHDQLAEGDKVMTRKTLRGAHRGEIFGIPATGAEVMIDVIDIVRVHEGRYAEHWGINTLSVVLAQLRDRPPTGRRVLG
jgi:predicted ester cyclase